ncbi:MAG: Na+/H+ antiporter subunit E [Lachnospiraceae bacterium]|nr:Na+/H+ antiporter subunit E [Lachnospiraceae bacterium]
MYLLFFAIWVIMNGRITLEVVLFGLVIATLMFAFVCKFMDYSIKKEVWLFKNFFLLLWYLIVLIVEILKANFAVVKMIFSVKYQIEPALVSFKSPLKTEFANFLLANSITLTPGTITVSSENGEFVVHCLDKDLAVGMDDSIFVHLLKKLEKGADNE